MRTEQKTDSLAELRRVQPAFRGLDPGHLACQGCGQALAARLVTEATGPDVVIANATGCLEVFTMAAHGLARALDPFGVRQRAGGGFRY